MKDLEEIRERARVLGLSTVTLAGTKRTLIPAIQLAEGREACFLTDHRLFCSNGDCEWRRDCLKLTAAWRR